MNEWLFEREWGGLGYAFLVGGKEKGGKGGFVWRGRRKDRRVVFVSVIIKMNNVLTLTLNPKQEYLTLSEGGYSENTIV